MNPLAAHQEGYTVWKEKHDEYPNILGPDVEKIQSLLSEGRISKDEARMLLGILADKASSGIKKELDSLISDGSTNKMLFLRYSWNG